MELAGTQASEQKSPYLHVGVLQGGCNVVKAGTVVHLIKHYKLHTNIASSTYALLTGAVLCQGYLLPRSAENIAYFVLWIMLVEALDDM